MGSKRTSNTATAAGSALPRAANRSISGKPDLSTVGTTGSLVGSRRWHLMNGTITLTCWQRSKWSVHYTFFSFLFFSFFPLLIVIYWFFSYHFIASLRMFLLSVPVNLQSGCFESYVYAIDRSILLRYYEYTKPSTFQFPLNFRSISCHGYQLKVHIVVKCI